MEKARSMIEKAERIEQMFKNPKRKAAFRSQPLENKKEEIVEDIKTEDNMLDLLDED